MGLAEDMLAYRAMNKVSQNELAKRCGVSLQTINTIENGVQKPRNTTAMRIRMVIGESNESQHNTGEVL